MLCIAVLGGLPGAGKSKFVSQLQTQVPFLFSSPTTVLPICYDDLLRNEGTLIEKQEWSLKRKCIKEAVSWLIANKLKVEPEKASSLDEDNNEFIPKLNEMTSQFTIGNSNVILLIDDNNYYRSMRHEYYSLARFHEIGFLTLWIEISLEESLERNNTRESSVPSHVIKTMNEVLERPDPFKNKWETFSFTLSGSEREPYPWQMIYEILTMALRHPVQNKEISKEVQDSSRASCSANVIHQSDNILRKKIHGELHDLRGKLSKEALKCKGRLYNEIKGEVLEDLKTGFRQVPTSLLKGLSLQSEGALEELKLLLIDLFDDKLACK